MREHLASLVLRAENKVYEYLEENLTISGQGIRLTGLWAAICIFLKFGILDKPNAQLWEALLVKA